jgi:hypothetical protein
MKRWTALLTIILLLILAVQPALADGITVVASDASVTFQKEAVFTLQVRSDNEITKVSIFYKLGDVGAVTTGLPTYQPGKDVTARFSWPLSNADIPSGVEITHWWMVEDRAGQRVRVDGKPLTYMDTRFSWKGLTSDRLTLYWYRGDEAFGKDLLGAATTALEQVSRDAGARLQRPAKLFIYGSFDDLRSGIGRSAQEWTGGRAFPEYDVILLGVPPNQASWGKRAIAHELTHLVVHQLVRGGFGDMPRWLDEGLAMYMEGPLDTEYSASLDGAIRGNTLLTLRTISSNFPADSRLATLAYAQSYSVVAFIIKAYGREKMAALLREFKEGNTYDGALTKVLGVDTEALDAAWRASVGAKPAPLPQATPQTAGPQGQPTPPPKPAGQPALTPTALALGVIFLMGVGVLAVLGFIAIFLLTGERRS